jgi:hypothetical protein
MIKPLYGVPQPIALEHGICKLMDRGGHVNAMPQIASARHFASPTSLLVGARTDESRSQ